MADVLKGFVNMLQYCLTALSSSKVLVHQQEIELQRNVQFIQVIMKIVKIVTTCFSIRPSLFCRSQGRVCQEKYHCRDTIALPLFIYTVEFYTFSGCTTMLANFCIFSLMFQTYHIVGENSWSLNLTVYLQNAYY